MLFRSTTWVSALPSLGWATSIKASNYTASANDQIFCNTSGGAVTITLPASATIGQSVKVIDYAGTWGTNNCTVGRNGNRINGDASDLVLDLNNGWVELIYADATQGWRVIQ